MQISKMNRSCRSADCTHRKYRFTRSSTIKLKDQENVKDQTTNYEKTQNKLVKTVQEPKDPFKEQLRLLIQSNSQYFQNKIKVSDSVKPNQYTFKIPTKTPKTVYKKHYTKKKTGHDYNNVNINSNTLNLTFGCSKPKNHFEPQTSYQNQFINMHSSELHKSSMDWKQKSLKQNNQRKTDNNWIDGDAPTFMQTQNKCFFLNWGGKNAITSMKPSHKTAAINIPFDGRTVYKNDFQGRSAPKNKLILPQSSITKSPNGFTLYKTSYAASFNDKENNPAVQISCKPKNLQMKKGIPFKNITQYKAQYIKVDKNQKNIYTDKNIQELTDLIINL